MALAETLRYFALILATIKIGEIICYIFWVATRGKTYRDDVLKEMEHNDSKAVDLYDIDIKHGVPWPLPWKIERHFLKSYVSNTYSFAYGRRANQFWGKIIHRQPSYVIIISLIIYLIPDRQFWWFEVVVIMLLIFSELVDILVARTILGYVDNLRCDFTFDPARSHSMDLTRDKLTFLRKFLMGIGIFVFCTIFGFGACYWSLYASLGPTAFLGLLEDGASIQFQLMYFSVCTIATGGYGDIHPGIALVQLFCMLEILFSMTVFTFIIFALSNTFSKDT